MENIKHCDEEIKDNNKIENTDVNKQLTKEVKCAIENANECFSSLFNSINILDASKEIFDIIQRINILSNDMKEIKILCEVVEYNYKKEDFIQKIKSDFNDVKNKGFNSITIDTDLGNTYYIKNTEKGFQCDLFDYVFEDLSIISGRVYDEIQGNIVDVRIDKV